MPARPLLNLMTIEPEMNWPLVTHSRREVFSPFDTDEYREIKRTTCPVCPHPAHSTRCRVMVEVYAGETSCGCPENDS